MMMSLRFGLSIGLVTLGLAGCSSFNNHSLDYINTTTLAPLELPANATVRPFTPLYPAPQVEQMAIEHAPKLENAKGTRFALPRPDATQTNAAAPSAAPVSTTVGRPQLLVDGNRNPLLQISGPTTDIWQYALATLSSLNYSIVSQNDARLEATITVDGQNYLLRLTGVGNSHNLALFNPNNSFAAPAQATAVLNQIYENWPV